MGGRTGITRLALSLYLVLVLVAVGFAQDSLSIEKVAELSSWSFAYDLEIQGEFAYLACGASGLRVLDISDIT
ncbi:hypothetical protein KKA00_07025, partial [bacterium]|nr:hypothetical protein [bacterium]